eukprot:CAMPEP_0174312756 /NCGR_PEP_ID=MMETSP0810-20121108/4498_1 /TAXON_ID=73025 ORGANISM="Eutreptiella gymnastica-like, Strain CCMP1594" /NCGR_SAMPLE_ID=MMETSP0810 /ASSEMBLY_ACC=CAM_ASM_000659 /LENGTH=243 /DNA_ID=CAMNT_0015421247 /DNA_START=98 /DNA_END=825 /DNA_ORIENTATION=-
MIPGLGNRMQRSDTPPPPSMASAPFVSANSSVNLGASGSATPPLNNAASSNPAPKESVSDNVVGYVPLSKENFIMDDCEVTLIGVKGNHMPFNDNCRSKRLHLCNKCKKPVIIFGRLLECKHAFCELCASTAKNKTCFTCGDFVKDVHPFSIEKGDISICEYTDSKGVCERSYVTAEDLMEHQRLRNHIPPPREEDMMLTLTNARSFSRNEYQDNRGRDGPRQGMPPGPQVGPQGYATRPAGG